MFVEWVPLPLSPTRTANSGSRSCNVCSSSCLSLLILGEQGSFGPGCASRLMRVLIVLESQLLRWRVLLWTGVSVPSLMRAVTFPSPVWIIPSHTLGLSSCKSFILWCLFLREGLAGEEGFALPL